MPKLIINNLNVKEKNADKVSKINYEIKIDRATVIETKKKYTEVEVEKGEHDIVITKKYVGKGTKKIYIKDEITKISVKMDFNLLTFLMLLEIISEFILRDMFYLRHAVSLCCFALIGWYIWLKKGVIKINVVN